MKYASYTVNNKSVERYLNRGTQIFQKFRSHLKTLGTMKPVPNGELIIIGATAHNLVAMAT